MIHPSYFELMDIVNKDVKEGEEPVITSRYSVVLGTAKRARQLVAAGTESRTGRPEKPLSIAVEELKNGGIHIIRKEEADRLREERAAKAAALAALAAEKAAAEAAEEEETVDPEEETAVVTDEQ